MHLIDILDKPLRICQKVFGFRRVLENFTDGCLRAFFRHSRDPDLGYVVEPCGLAPHPLPLGPCDVEILPLEVFLRHHEKYVHVRVRFTRFAARDFNVSKVSKHGCFERLQMHEALPCRVKAADFFAKFGNCNVPNGQR